MTEVVTSPGLEDQQCPERLAVVSASAQVLGQDACNGARIEEPPDRNRSAARISLSVETSGPRNHCSNGTSKSFLRRAAISGGRRSTNARLSKRLSPPKPRNLSVAGIWAVISTKAGSSNSARSSRPVAMLEDAPGAARDHAEGGPITPTREGRGTNEQADLSTHDHLISWVGALQVVVIEGRATTKVRAVLDGHSPFGRPNPGPRAS